MSESSKPPVLWSVVITRWALGVLSLVVLVIALRPGIVSMLRGKARFTTAGDAADIRLVGVAPDGDDALYGADGKLINGAKLEWQGERVYNWQPGAMQRDFLFEFGPGTEGIDLVPDNPLRVLPAAENGWPMSVSIGQAGGRTRSPAGREETLVRATLGTNYYQNGFLLGGRRQRLLETVNLQLYFYPRERGAAERHFQGPFAVGKTNAPQDKSLVSVTILPPGDQGGASGLVRLWSTNMYSHNNTMLFYDQEGRRHFPRGIHLVSGGIGYTNLFELPDFPLTNLAHVTVGEQFRTKEFRNVALVYPGRPARAYSPVLDRLANALGRTKVDAARLAQTSPRSHAEALTMLQFIPGQKSAMSYLAYSGLATNFAELRPAQQEEVRALARAWADHTEPQHRSLGLRAGLRGGWPEFTALAITRLREGSRGDQSAAADTLSSHPARLGAADVPLLAALARTNSFPDVVYQLVNILGNLGVPAAQDALLELAGSDDIWRWWQTFGYLPLARFEPIEAQPAEMQQRLWMVRDVKPGVVTPENEAVARARLAALINPQLCATAVAVFNSAAQRCATRLGRAVALDTYAKYMRAAGNEHLRRYPPMTIIQRVNEWHGQDFGGLGDGKKSGTRYPSSDEYPGVVEDVLEFCDKLQRAGK